MTKFERFKMFINDNKFYISYHVLGFLVSFYGINLIFDEVIIITPIWILIWGFWIFPSSYRWYDKFPIFDGNLDDDEQIIYEDIVFFLYFGETRYKFFITNKSLIFENCYKVKNPNIRIPIDSILSINNNKKWINLSIKYLSDLNFKSKNADKILEIISNIRSNHIDKKFLDVNFK
jgi:hypothetical protein